MHGGHGALPPDLQGPGSLAISPEWYAIPLITTAGNVLKSLVTLPSRSKTLKKSYTNIWRYGCKPGSYPVRNCCLCAEYRRAGPGDPRPPDPGPPR